MKDLTLKTKDLTIKDNSKQPIGIAMHDIKAGKPLQVMLTGSEIISMRDIWEAKVSYVVSGCGY